MNSDDAEITAIRELYRLLKPFDRTAQERIAGYVGSRLATEATAGCAAEAQLVPPAPLNYAIGRL